MEAETLKLTSEPADDDEIAMHERNYCPCVSCIDKARLIARIRETEALRRRVFAVVVGNYSPDEVVSLHLTKRGAVAATKGYPHHRVVEMEVEE